MTGPRHNRLLGRLLHRLTRIAGNVFLLSLPIGYYPDNPDSTDVMIGVHGGFGQVATVIRDCSGNAITSAANPYRDIAGTAAIKVPATPVAVGIRSGSVSLDLASRDSVSWDGPIMTHHWGWHRTAFTYSNPHISLEEKYIGLGFGYVFGTLPTEVEELRYDGGERIKYSGHLRIGELQRAYFLASLAENTPIISGGGWFDVGVGYRASPWFLGFSGISAGLSDDITFLQQGRIRASRFLDFDVAIRLGTGGSTFDGGVSVGLNLRLDLPKH